MGRLELVCAYRNPVVRVRESTSFGARPREHDLSVKAPNRLDGVREPDEFPEPEVCRVSIDMSLVLRSTLAARLLRSGTCRETWLCCIDKL